MRYRNALDLGPRHGALFRGRLALVLFDLFDLDIFKLNFHLKTLV